MRDDLVTGVQTCALPIYFCLCGRHANKSSAAGEGAERICESKPRSEERRVGKECRSRRTTYELKTTTGSGSRSIPCRFARCSNSKPKIAQIWRYSARTSV